ncbi:DUF4328 domain-containing protein [Flammeovirga sp. MY04]|uniref:DUF4328 domain-containing protein n=1 Tax=Flammeovirga sp. MY04 TaxID=1191459 RepID=UPI00080622DA|nr:DUF4328 domain-containing protein [Flammeovirga sp. MY04]ANQ48848.1 DUF4328 domain-containing protein [Flammeovirga sp. MY04]
MEQLRVNNQRASIAKIFLGFMCFLSFVMMVNHIIIYNILIDIEDQSALADDYIMFFGIPLGLNVFAQFGYVIGLIVTGILFIKWMRRAYYNLKLKVDYLGYSESETVWSWFIPFLNWVRPYQIMSELFLELRQYLQKNGQEIKDNSFMVNIWWGLWVVNNVLNTITSKLYTLEETVEKLKTGTAVEIFSSAVSIIAALLAIKMISYYNEMETKMIDTSSEAEEGNISLA